MSLRLITPPTVEPVSLETVKEFLRVDGTDEDAAIAQLMKRARETGEELSRRAFLTQTLEMTLDAWPVDGQVRLWRPPLQSVTSVTYYDENNVSALWTDYVVDVHSEPGCVHFKSTPNISLLASGGIVIRYVAGYGSTEAAVPETIKGAILALTAFWYENREAVNIGNITSELPFGPKQAFLSERMLWFS